MSVEESTYHALELETAWRADDVKTCYRLLASMPDGVVFKTDNLLLVLSPAIDAEKDLMRRSIEERREFGLVKTSEKETVIGGTQRTVDLDDIAGALYDTAKPEEPAIFSHTHWDSNIHPLPGYAEIGIGDIGIFDFFIRGFPLLECRIAFNSDSAVRAIVYKGKVEE